MAPFWPHFGSIWPLFGLILGPILGPISDPILAPFRGRFWSHLGGPSGPPLERKHKETNGFGAFLDPLRGTFGPLCGPVLGSFLAPFWSHFGPPFGPNFGHFLTHFRILRFPVILERFSRNYWPRKIFRDDFEGISGIRTWTRQNQLLAYGTVVL